MSVKNKTKKELNNEILSLQKRVAELELNNKKDMTQIYLDIAEVMILVIGENEEVNLINKKGCKILEYKHDEIIGRNWFEHFLPEEIREKTKAVYRKLMRGEINAVEYHENNILTKSGKERLIAWHNSVLANKSGHIIGTVSSGIDITEQKQAEERFRLAVESSPNGIVMVDSEGKIIMVNSHIEMLFGYNREELIEQPVELLIPDNFRSVHLKHRKDFFTNPSERPMGAGRDLFAKRKDGTEFPVEIGLSPIELEGNTVVLSTITDISERKRAEKLIRQSEEKLRLIMDNTTDSILVFDTNGKITGINSEAKSMLNKKGSKIINSIWELVPPENKPKFSEELKKVKEGRRLFDWETEILLANGERLAVSVGLVYVEESSGIFIETIRDISERVALRNKIIEFEKTQIVANMAEGIAHHMGTPLTSMLLRIQMLKEDIETFPEHQKIMEKLETVEKQIFYGQKVMQRLLKFASKPINQKQAVIISSLIIEASEIIKPLCNKSDIDIELTLDNDPKVMVDSDMLALVLSDMMMNAIEAMPEGGKLTINVSTISYPDSIAIIKISDTGTGIPNDILPQVFEPFFSTKPAGKGTGLGLAVAKRIIHDHRGQISIQSIEGDGTTIKIEIPIYEEVIE